MPIGRDQQLLSRKRIRAGIGTRHVYGYEDKVLSTIQTLSKQQDLALLTKLGHKIWADHYHGKRQIPTIRFGSGTKELGYATSYTLGFKLIELAPKQRDILTLIHEITHAIGPSLHGINFTKVYYNILKDYLPDDKTREEVYNVLVTKHQELLNPYYKKLTSSSKLSRT